MRIPLTGLLVLGVLSIPGGLLADSKMSVQQRLDRLERLSRNQNMADMVYQMQQLKQEVQRLNGELEMQKHAMDAMNRRQRDLYLDIDQRLSRVQPSGVQSSTPTSVAAPVPVPAAPAAPATPAPQSVAAAAPPARQVTPPDPKKEAEAYQSAFNLLKQGRYPESIKAFSQFLENFPGGSFEDNAQYWLAEASYVNRDFEVALGDFQKVLSNHPQSAKVPGAMLKMGYIHYELKRWGEAREVLQSLQQKYTRSTEARLAEKRLQRMTKEGH
jgi:tol-pal system protein YbgF